MTSRRLGCSEVVDDPRGRATRGWAVMNAFDRTYIGSVTINGFGGRVMEPAPGRHLWVGLELDWRARAR